MSYRKLIDFVFYLTLTLGLSLSATSPLFASVDGREIEYEELNTLIDFGKNKTTSPYMTMRASLTIKDDTLTLADVELWILENGKPLQQIPIAKDGTIDLPLFDKERVKQITLSINQPKGAVALGLAAGFKAPEQSTVKYQSLFSALDDTNLFMKEMSGMASWLMPSMDDLLFTFDQPATIEIVTKNKTYRYQTNDELQIDITRKANLMKENPDVIFSVQPTSISPEN